MSKEIGTTIMIQGKPARIIGLDKHHVTVDIQGKKITYPLKEGTNAIQQRN